MPKYLLLTCLLLFVTQIKSENPDSLRISIEKAVTAKDKIPALIILSKYWISNNPDSAIYYSGKLQQVALAIQDTDGYFRGSYNLVSGLYETGKRDEALIQAQKAIAFFHQKKHNEYKVKLLILIAEKSRELWHYDAAIRYFREAASCWDISKKDNTRSLIFSRLAAICFEMNNFHLVEAYIDSSQRALTPEKNERISISNLEILGASYRQQGRYRKAIDCFRQAILKITDESFMSIEANLYNNLAKTYLLMNDFPKALSISLKANEVSGKVKNTTLLQFSAENLAKAYAGTGNYKQAYKYLNIEQNLKQQRFNEDQDKRIADMNALYESGKKEARIAEQNYMIRQEKRQNNYLIAGIILVVLILMYVVFTQLKLKTVNRLLFLKNEEINRQAGELETKNQKLHKLSDFKEAMTGMVIHDLKNPLNTMINLQHIEKNPEKALVIIERTGKAALNLVMNVLDVYKYENTALKIREEAANICKIAWEACNDIRFLAQEKNLNINVIANADFIINADCELVQRVFSNLLSNAIKFSKSGENIDIDIHESEPGWLKVEVSDKGDGIDQEILPLVFDKFAQAEKKKSGLAGSTGLGLAFCKMVIEAHGGNIGATSEIGNGSVFWFTLPLIKKLESADSFVKNQQISNKTEKLQLCKSAIEELAPYLSKLRKLDVYEVSEIHVCLKTIPISKDVDIQLWKEEVYQAVNTMNGKYYHSLINQYR